MIQQSKSPTGKEFILVLGGIEDFSTRHSVNSATATFRFNSMVVPTVESCSEPVMLTGASKKLE